MKSVGSWLGLAGVGIFVSLGCSGLIEKAQQKVAEEAVEKSLEAASGGDVEIQGETLQIQTGDQTLAMGSGAKMPDGWPSAVPAYPGAQVAMSSTDASNGVHTMMVMQQTADASDKVVAFYKANCPGCPVQTEADVAGQGQTVVFTLPNPPAGSLTLSTLTTSDQPTMVTLVVSRP